ncbi:MFS transporter [Methanomicrobiaceae archaeon CYW5]|uniref:MFS transporter n=1 Tax=Methanovulcanius yangii TaxID=1789227 RepID=UPI0029C9E4CB|nr:MFS transporter [Methanovulcanius yangii]MBT8508217.1 MFS transporter [Methanovulcanius yangii]
MQHPAGPDVLRRNAYLLIVLFGIVAMFGDVIYEGARSVAGPYLYYLGATAFVVGLVAGVGEFLGYLLRLVSGYLADMTRHYWTLVFLGYGMLIAVPFLALAGSWEAAAGLYIVERMGKGIRAPAKDAILSNLTASTGRGWGFGIHEALDQVGAVVGPLIFTGAYLAQGDYRGGFALLAVPFVLMIAVLVIMRFRAPDPATFEPYAALEKEAPPLRALARYGIFTALTVAGFAAFPLISFHFVAEGIVPGAQIPLFYAIAMGVDAVVALVAGRAYDRFGLGTLVLMPVLGMAVPLLVFGTAYAAALAGAVLWGAVMGVQETVLRAAVADYTHISKRGRAYGIFNTIYGASFFAGGLAAGWLYMVSRPTMIFLMVALQVAALGVFVLAKKDLEGNMGGRKGGEPV